MSADSEQRTEQLVSMLTQHQQALFRYIFSLLPNEADARDVLQETSLALSRKFEQYDVARPFLAWAFRFAYLQVLKHREKQQRSPLTFADDVLELLAEERAQLEPHLDERLGALESCLAKLPAEDRQMMTFRYQTRHSTEELMERLAMSRRTLFRNLERVRRRLAECVTRQFQTEGF